MTDVNYLTIVVACVGILLIERIPEQPCDDWSFKRLTIHLIGVSILMAGIVFSLARIITW